MLLIKISEDCYVNPEEVSSVSIGMTDDVHVSLKNGNVLVSEYDLETTVKLLVPISRIRK